MPSSHGKQPEKPIPMLQSQVSPPNPVPWQPTLQPAALVQRAFSYPATLTPAEVLQLHHTIGNRAVGQLVRGHLSRQATGPSPSPVGTTVQPKLMLGPVGDRYEQEADRVAQQVVQRLDTVAQPPDGQAVQRQEEDDKELLQMQPAAIQAQQAESDIALSPALEAVIQQARGGGQPLPTTLCGRMEQAFGADFGGVRLHADTQADALTRALGAKAFTTGEDVFFREGAYTPASQSGQEVLAHELAHVVQQMSPTVLSNAADNAVTAPHHLGGSHSVPTVQRKVGFEFETGLPLKTASNELLGYTHSPVFRSSSRDWKIVPDGSKIEFVTEPFQEEGNNPEYTRLETAMQEIVQWIEEMKSKGSQLPPGQGLYLRNIGKSVGGALKYRQESVQLPDYKNQVEPIPVTASPQATGGVSLEKVPTLIKETRHRTFDPSQLSVREGQQPTFSGMEPIHADILQESAILAEKEFRDLAGLAEVQHVDKLIGLVALVVSYLRMGEELPGVAPYSKIIAPLMAHTNFYAMYQELSEDEKALFTEENILAAAQMPGTGHEYVFKHGFGKGRAELGEKGPTRREWIKSIRMGAISAAGKKKGQRVAADLMSRPAMTPVVAGRAGTRGASSSMGNMAMVDDLAILEMRRLPKGVPYTNWWYLAQTLFNFFREVQGYEPIRDSQ